MKPDDKRARASAEAARLAEQQKEGGSTLPVIETIRLLTISAATPKRSGTPVLRIDGADHKGIRLTLLNKGGATRDDVEKAIREVLDQHWA